MGLGSLPGNTKMVYNINGVFKNTQAWVKLGISKNVLLQNNKAVIR